MTQAELESRTRLVVSDDDQPLLDSLCQLLDEAGFEIIGTATNGIDTINVVTALRPDILITDLRMPGLTGLEVAEQLQQTMPEVKILILSAYDDPGLQMVAERIPVTAYLVKGCSSRLILAAIDDATNTDHLPLLTHHLNRPTQTTTVP